MSKLLRKVALVTGASKGIGAGIAKELAAAGAAGEHPMPAHIMFIREETLDESRIKVHWSKVLPTLDCRSSKVLAPTTRQVTPEGPVTRGVVVAVFPSHEVARAWYENPACQAAAQRQFDSWLADMEYCDRF